MHACLDIIRRTEHQVSLAQSFVGFLRLVASVFITGDELHK